MAQAGIGVDIVEISHMEQVLERNPAFATRFFTEEERAYCDGRPRPGAHYASLFAAREAVLKSLGIGFGQGAGRYDVCVTFDEKDHPSAVLSGGALEVAEELGVVEIALSLSCTGELAVANAMAITADARPKPKIDADDARTRMARSFRDARSVLDELDQAQENGLIATPGAAASQGEGRKEDDEASSEH